MLSRLDRNEHERYQGFSDWLDGMGQERPVPGSEHSMGCNGTL